MQLICIFNALFDTMNLSDDSELPLPNYAKTRQDRVNQKNATNNCNDAKIVFFVLYNAALVISLAFGVDMYLDDDDVEQRTGLILLAISAVLLAINFLWLVCGYSFIQ